MHRLALVGAGSALAGGAAAIVLFTTLRETLAAIREPGRTSLTELVTAGSAAAALGLLAWVCLGLLVSVAATLPGPFGRIAARGRDQVAGLAVRRWAAILLGVSIASTCAPGGAVAQPVAITLSTDEAAADEHPQDAPAPLWVKPSAPAPAPQWTPTQVRELPPVTLTAPREIAAEQARVEVTVRRGDTLWDLAAAYLPAEATDAEIAAEWPRWYALNRGVIGPDPDLIRPGQVLIVPTATADALSPGGAR